MNSKRRTILSGVVLFFFIPLVLHTQILEPSKEPIWTFSVESSPTDERTFDLVAHVRIPTGFYQDADSPFLIFETEPSVAAGPISTSQAQVRAGKSSFTGRMTLRRTLLQPLRDGQTLTVHYGWQICQVDGVCLLPVEKTWTATYDGTRLSPAQAVPEQEVSSSPESSIWIYLAFAFLGGLFMNAMPCVFPLLSIRALSIVRSSNQNRSVVRRSQLAFATGIVASVLALGVTIAAFRWAGTALTWGFYFQNTGFVVAVLLLFWILALQLWGVFHWSVSVNVRTGTGIASSFFAGVAEVIAAAPCTAPFLGPAMGFALTQDPWTIVAMFTVVGLGLAFPPIVLALLPRWAEKLPKPGPWLETFERVMAFFLAASALYMLWILSRQGGEGLVFAALALLLFVSLVFWIAGKAAPALKTRSRSVAFWASVWFLVTAGAIFVALPQHESSSNESGIRSPWIEFTASEFERAIGDGRTVFVDVTAAWCATCQVNEATTLERKDVLELFASRNVRLIRADLTNRNPEIETWLSRNGRVGLPVYALFRPGRPVEFFPEILTKENFVDRISKLP